MRPVPQAITVNVIASNKAGPMLRSLAGPPVANLGFKTVPALVVQMNSMLGGVLFL